MGVCRSRQQEGPFPTSRSLFASNSKPKYRVISSTEAHREVARKNLKTALTHPTILKFLRAYMKAQDLENCLDLYLQLVYWRSKATDEPQIIDELKSLAQEIVIKYLMQSSASYFEINEHHRFGIIGALGSGEKDSIVDLKRLSRVIQAVQFEVFYFIMEKSWLPFCESPEYSEMTRKKEVRTLMVLFDPTERPKGKREAARGDKFSSVAISDRSSSKALDIDDSDLSRITHCYPL